MTTTTATRSRAAAPGPIRWLAGAALVGSLLVLLGGADVVEAFELFPVEVLMIFMALDLFTGLVAQTGILDALALGAARRSRGQHRRLLAFFAAVLMGIGVANNNLTSLLIVMPPLITVMRAMRVSPRTIHLTFAMLLAVGNCAGAATPVGDFPALLIMAAGVTTFTDYLFLAFPLFAATAAVLVMLYRCISPRSDTAETSTPAMCLALIEARHRYSRVDVPAATRLGAIFVAMVLCWVFVPPATMPPVLISWLGMAIGSVAVAGRGIGPRLTTFDLDPALEIAAVAFVAALISTTGAIAWITRAIEDVSTTPVVVLLLLMVVTTAVCAVVDAGGAATALLPLVAGLSAPGAPLDDVRAITVVAFAASICAGSSLLLTSATAGQLMSAKIEAADLLDGDGRAVRFTFKDYLRLGAMNCGVQLLIAVAWSVTALAIAGELL